MSACRYTVLLLAGRRRGKDPVCEAYGSRYKSLVKVAGVPMIMHPLTELAASPQVAEIIIVAQEPNMFAALTSVDIKKIRVCSSTDSIADTVLAVFRGLADGTPLLVTTADNCLLTREHLDDFLAQAGQKAADADIVIGFAEKKSLLDEYPATRRSWINLSDTSLSGCNLFLLQGRHAEKAISFWKQFESRPKKLTGLARALGPTVLWSYICRQLSSATAFDTLSRLTGARIRPVIMHNPELAIDADKIIDIRQIESILKHRETIRLISAQRPAERRLVIFDLDRTITSFGTYFPFLIFYAGRHRPSGFFTIPLVLLAMLAYGLKIINRNRLKSLMFGLLIGRPPVAQLLECCTFFVDKTLSQQVYVEALQAIRHWREQGAILVLATASYDWMAHIFGRKLGFDHVLATESVQRDGRIIPGIHGENCYGMHKFATLVERYGALRAWRRENWQIWFYSDHHSDIPLLARVDHPKVVNPTRKLRKWAAATAYAEILEWRNITITRPGSPSTASSETAESRQS